MTICCINNWKDVIENIYKQILKNYELYNTIDEIRCIVSCHDESFKKFYFFLDSKVKILKHYEKNYGFTFEKFMMDKLLDDSKKESFNVLYLHSKGVSDRHQNNKEIISNWTNVMLHYCIKYSKDIINNYLKKYSVVGVNLIFDPVPHFYGNFWWSSSNHIKNLDICGPIYPDAEFWITTINGLYLSLYNHGKSLYHYNLKYSEYENIIEHNEYYITNYDKNDSIYYGYKNYKLINFEKLKKFETDLDTIFITNNDSIRSYHFGDTDFGYKKNIRINNKIFNKDVNIILKYNIVKLNFHNEFVYDNFIQICIDNQLIDITYKIFRYFNDGKNIFIPDDKTLLNKILFSNYYNENTFEYIIVNECKYKNKNIKILNIYYKQNINIITDNVITYGYKDNKINITNLCHEYFYYKKINKLIIPNCLCTRNEIFGKLKTIDDRMPSIYINNIEYYDTMIKFNNIKFINYKYKSIILYSYYQRNNEYKNQTNFDYFMKYGYKNINNSLIVIINNGYSEFSDKYFENIKNLNKSNELVITTINYHNDFESWNYAINLIEEKYNDKIYYLSKYLCLCNCSVFGPIILNDNNDWSDIFINKLESDNAVACSPMLNYLNINDAGGPGYRLTSYFIFIKIDNKILNLLTNKQINNICNESLNISNYPVHYNTVIGKKQNKLDTVLTGEYGLSRILIMNNYNITSLVTCNNKKENIDRSFDNYKLEYNLEDLIFIKINFRTDLNRASLPVYYDECLNYYYKNLNYINKEVNLEENNFLLNYDNLLINEKGINTYNSNYNWNSYNEFYNLYGKAENFYIFTKPNINNSKCIIIINQIDNQYLDNYLINNFNELLLLNYDIYFCTNCYIKNFQLKDVYNLFICENSKTTDDLLINFIIKNKEIIKQKYDKLSIVNTNIVFGLQSYENTLNIINEYNKYDIWSLFYDNKKINNDFIEFSRILFDELFDVILHNKYFEYDFSYLINKYTYGYIYTNVEDLSKLNIYSEFLLFINNDKIFCVNVKKIDELNLNYKKNYRLNYLLRFYI